MKVFNSRKLLPFGVLVLLATLIVQGAATKGPAVKDLSFASTGTSVEVKISASEGAHYTYFELSHPTRLVVDFHDIQNNVGFREKSIQAAGVERVRTSTFEDKKRRVTRIVFDMNPATPYRFKDENGGIVKIVFGDPVKDASKDVPAAVSAAAPARISIAAAQEKPIPIPVKLAALEEPARVPLNPPAMSSPIPAAPKVQTPASASSPQANTETSQYTGEIYSFNFTDLSLRDFFQLISKISGLNIIVDRNVTGTLPVLQLNAVPWDQALDVVLKDNQLGSELQGNILRIATLDTLQKEQDAKSKLRDAVDNAAALETRTYVLNYTKAAEVMATLAKMVSQRGSVIQDQRRNALIVSDIPSRFDKIEQTVKFLDTAAQQVEIEARIVSANKSFSRDIGNQLGFLFGNNRNNQVSGATTAGTSPLTRPGQAAGLPLAVNLPAAATSGLSILSGVGGDILLDEILTAAEASGTAKVISRPKVVTQNNQPASVKNGTQIPVQTNVNNTVSVQFLTFALTLTVTPQITDVGTILMTVNIENSQPDFAKAVNGIPSVATQSATTQYLIKDGGTQSIAGILVDNDSLNVRQVPGIGSLPLIGNLFKETSVIKSTSELIFFLTARILPADGSGVQVTSPEATMPKPPGR